MKNEHLHTKTNTGRWLRVGLLSLTFFASIASNIKYFLRKRQEMLFTTATDTAQRAGMNTTIKQLSATGRDWSYGLFKRGGQVTRDLTERGSQVRHVLADRGGQVTRDLTERGSQVTHVMAERGDQLLQPLRKRSGTFWTVLGFSLGMVAAAVITFVLLRKRLGKQSADEEEGQIELPQQQNLNGASSLGQERPGKPADEILHLDNEGNSAATMQTVGVNSAKAVEVPANAAFAGVVGTKRYYPLEKLPGESAQETIFFVSEDEARAQGYSAAE